MSFKMRAERTSCARHITLDWIGCLQFCSIRDMFALVSAKWNAVSRQIWRGCHTSVDSGDLNQAPPKQSAVCSTCMIPALPVNCQFIWMACAFGMSATQPISGLMGSNIKGPWQPGHQCESIHWSIIYTVVCTVHKSANCGSQHRANK